MKTLAILQNAYFHDPERVRQTLARHPAPSFRRRFIATTLFAGCLTGRRLNALFGHHMDDWMFEEASREIGGHSGSAFPADLDHLRAVLDDVKPDIVISFGRIASDGVEKIAFDLTFCAGDTGEFTSQPWHHIKAPHPASRSDAIGGLQDALNEYLRVKKLLATRPLEHPSLI